MTGIETMRCIVSGDRGYIWKARRHSEGYAFYFGLLISEWQRDEVWALVYITVKRRKKKNKLRARERVKKRERKSKSRANHDK